MKKTKDEQEGATPPETAAETPNHTESEGLPGVVASAARTAVFGPEQPISIVSPRRKLCAELSLSCGVSDEQLFADALAMIQTLQEQLAATPVKG